MLGDLLSGALDDGRTLGGGGTTTTRGHEATLLDGIGDDTAHEVGRANGVVVAGDDVLDDVGVAVGVDHGDDRKTELVRLGHRDVLLLRVEHEDGARGALHVANAAEVALELLELAADEESFLLGHGLELTRVAHALVFLHLGHALGHGLEVGEHAAEPTLIDIGHAATLGVAAHRILGLLLGAHEQDGAAIGDEIAHEAVRGLDASERLLEIDDVDAVALTVDEALHLGVPASGLMSEVDTCLEQLAHRYDWSHGCSSPIG